MRSAMIPLLVLLFSCVGRAHGACFDSSSTRSLTQQNGTISRQGTFENYDRCTWQFPHHSFIYLLKLDLTYLSMSYKENCGEGGGSLQMPDGTRQCYGIKPDAPAKCFIYSTPSMLSGCSGYIAANPGCTNSTSSNLPFTIVYDAGKESLKYHGFILDYEVVDCSSPVTTTTTTPTTTTTTTSTITSGPMTTTSSTTTTTSVPETEALACKQQCPTESMISPLVIILSALSAVLAIALTVMVVRQHLQRKQSRPIPPSSNAPSSLNHAATAIRDNEGYEDVNAGPKPSESNTGDEGYEIPHNYEEIKDGDQPQGGRVREEGPYVSPIQYHAYDI